MTDYAEERRSELEVLESIFPDELTVLSDDKISLRVEPDEQSPSEPYVLSLIITYTPTYPDEIPVIEIEALEGEISEQENEQLVKGLEGAATDSLGMAMVYTLSSYLKDSLAELVRERKARIAKEEAEKERIEEEAAAKKTAGTKVTPESFAKWKIKFEKEMAELRAKEEQERLKALPPKEREEVKKYNTKLSGRQLFEKGDPSLATSDSGFDDDDGVEVDMSLYERTEGLHLTDDEDEHGPKLAELSDSD